MVAGRSNEPDTADSAAESTLRIDLWLWYARFFKSRSLATDAVQGGKVHVNSQRVKPAHRVRVGDTVTVGRSGVDQVVEVRSLPERRGAATEASLSYSESAASIAKREAFAVQQRLAAAYAPRSTARPDKHERRSLRRLRGRDA